MRKWLLIALFLSLCSLITAPALYAETSCGVLESGSGRGTLGPFGPYDIPSEKTLTITMLTQAGQSTAILAAIGGTPIVQSVEFTATHTVNIPGPLQNVQIVLLWQSGSAAGNSFTIAIGPCPGVRVPPDDRLNWELGDLSAVLYAREQNGSPVIEVYEVQADGRGAFSFAITEADLAPYIDNPPEVNTEIKSVGIVTLYALTTGEFQVNIGPDGEGKVWSVVFDGIKGEKVYGYEWDADGA